MPEIRQKEELESTYLSRHVDIGLSIYLKKDTVMYEGRTLFDADRLVVQVVFKARLIYFKKSEILHTNII